jgi:C4-type Zn-finger protein
MKVIKYGSGNEPKRITCDSCKSELEYIQDNIQYYNSTVREKKNACKQMFLKYITCPVCKTWIELSLKTIDAPIFPPSGYPF